MFIAHEPQMPSPHYLAEDAGLESALTSPSHRRRAPRIDGVRDVGSMLVLDLDERIQDHERPRWRRAASALIGVEVGRRSRGARAARRAPSREIDQVAAATVSVAAPGPIEHFALFDVGLRGERQMRTSRRLRAPVLRVRDSFAAGRPQRTRADHVSAARQERARARANKAIRSNTAPATVETPEGLSRSCSVLDISLYTLLRRQISLRRDRRPRTRTVSLFSRAAVRGRRRPPPPTRARRQAEETQHDR